MKYVFSYEYPISNIGHISSPPNLGDLNRQFKVFCDQKVSHELILLLGFLSQNHEYITNHNIDPRCNNNCHRVCIVGDLLYGSHT